MVAITDGSRGSSICTLGRLLVSLAAPCWRCCRRSGLCLLHLAVLGQLREPACVEHAAQCWLMLKLAVPLSLRPAAGGPALLDQGPASGLLWGRGRLRSGCAAWAAGGPRSSSRRQLRLALRLGGDCQDRRQPDERGYRGARAGLSHACRHPAQPAAPPGAAHAASCCPWLVRRCVFLMAPC